MLLLIPGMIALINTGMDSECIYRWMPAFLIT
ncbi:MAG: hypothetical protein ACTHYN_00580 [Marinobacter sp.]